MDGFMGVRKHRPLLLLLFIMNSGSLPLSLTSCVTPPPGPPERPTRLPRGLRSGHAAVYPQLASNLTWALFPRTDEAHEGGRAAPRSTCGPGSLPFSAPAPHTQPCEDGQHARGPQRSPSHYPRLPSTAREP